MLVIPSRADGEGPHNSSKITQTKSVMFDTKTSRIA